MPAEGTTAKVAGIIPARWGSSRFPGKPLHRLAGKTLLHHVLERVGNCEELALVVVATDDERIATEARSLGAEVAMTSPDHPSGTDRVAEAVQTHPGITHVINIQGDEPLIDPSLVDSFASSLQANPELPMITAASPIIQNKGIFSGQPRNDRSTVGGENEKAEEATKRLVEAGEAEKSDWKRRNRNRG